MSSMLDSVFRGLAQHYEENDMDVALRMDVIMQLVQDVEVKMCKLKLIMGVHHFGVRGNVGRLCTIISLFINI